MRILTPYTLTTDKLKQPLVFAVVSDLHDEPYDDIWPLIEGADALLVPGDVSNRYRGSYTQGLQFLQDAAKRLPTFYSLGNHETRLKDFRGFVHAAEQTGAEVLINRYVPFRDAWIGGWYDSEVVTEPDMMDAFEKLDGYKVLLCHKPDHYIKYLRHRQADLVVAGHAHGGQIRLFDRGIYAPGQFLLPQYTRGVVDGRMIVSAGAGNPVHLPRWNNPCEVLRITVQKEDADHEQH